MNEFKLHDFNTLEWQKVRGDITTNIFGKATNVDLLHSKISLTKVEPEGRFATHIDDYDHLFIILEGTLHFIIDNSEFEVSANQIVEIKSGIPHSYNNTTIEDVVLLTFNIEKKE